MFIRKTRKKDKKTKKDYYSYQLIESVRTERGPRQHILLHLGSDLDLTKEECSQLANCIKDITTGTQRLFPYPKKIEALAEGFARQVIRKQSEILQETKQTKNEKIKNKETKNTELQTDYQTIDCNTIEHEYARTVGIEYIAYETFRELGLDKKFIEIGLSNRQVAIATGVIIGKLVQPTSERGTHKWLQTQSAIDELLGTDFTRLSMNLVYQISDKLLKNKDVIESHLEKTEKDLFNLDETIVLYDLTNTYFEGTAKGVKKAQRGRSKEKRSDCPLVTLGLVINSQGFIKKSEVLPGNISEPKTLKEAIKKLEYEKEKPPIIVLDAGFATEENLQWLREEKYRYIVCSREKKLEVPDDEKFEIVKENKVNTVKASKIDDTEKNEIFLYCYSKMKEKKEQSMQTAFQKRFEKALEQAKSSLSKPKGIKTYEKVVEKIGRIKEKHKGISSHYEITVKKDPSSNLAIDITWELNKESCQKRFSGIYKLRAYGLDWGSKKLWETYTMLTEVEESFRCLKSELGLRPVYHQKENRVDGHLFITILAYHIMRSILHKLELSGQKLKWRTLCRAMSTQVRVTTSMQTKEGQKIYVRKTTKPESFHKEIYTALELSSNPCGTVKTIV